MKRFLILHQRPGNDQKLSRQLDSHLRLDPRLSFPAPQLIGEIDDKVPVPDRSNESRPVHRANRRDLLAGLWMAIGRAGADGES